MLEIIINVLVLLALLALLLRRLGRNEFRRTKALKLLAQDLQFVERIVRRQLLLDSIVGALIASLFHIALVSILALLASGTFRASAFATFEANLKTLTQYRSRPSTMMVLGGATYATATVLALAYLPIRQSSKDWLFSMSALKATSLSPTRIPLCVSRLMDRLSACTSVTFLEICLPFSRLIQGKYKLETVWFWLLYHTSNSDLSSDAKKRVHDRISNEILQWDNDRFQELSPRERRVLNYDRAREQFGGQLRKMPIAAVLFAMLLVVHIVVIAAIPVPTLAQLFD